MSKILFKAIALGSRRVGCGKYCNCKSANSKVLYSYYPLSRNFCQIDVQRLNSTPAAIKTAGHVEKSDDTESQIIKNVAELPNVKYKIAVNHENLVSSLNKCSSISDQIKEMCLQLSMSDEEKEARLKLSKELEAIIIPYFPNCRVVLVGSSINGLGLKGCDIDLSFETGWDPSMKDPMLFANRLPSVEDVDDGKVPVSKIQQFSPKQQMRFVRRVLTKHWNGITGSRTLLPGRCPLIQFQYGPNNISCDLSFGNTASIVSSKLLFFCGKLDERVISISKIINYWAKWNNLIGGTERFKSYAFSLLVIHFLQTRNPPILPPLRDVLQKADFFRDNVLWDFDLSQDLSKFPKSRNKETVEELLKEFFFFYLYFDFTRIIYPLDGITLSKSASGQVTGNFELASSICVLDPFNDAWNVTRIVSYKHCKVFIMQLMAMCKVCVDQALWLPSTPNWGLAAVIDQQFSRAMLEENLTEFPIAKCAISTHSRESINSWLMGVSIAVLKVLNYALLFECHVTRQSHIIFQNSNSPTSIKLSTLNFRNGRTFEVSDFPDVKHEKIPEAEPLLSVQCTAVNTWQGRCHWNEKHFSSDIAENPLELEHAISLKLLENTCDHDKQVFEFAFRCVESKEGSELFLNFMLSPIETCKIPTKAAIFLKKYIPSLVEKICM